MLLKRGSIGRRIALIALACALPFAWRFCEDVREFHEAAHEARGQEHRQYYSPSWLAHPYSNARLRMLPHKEYWVVDRAASRRVLIREVAFEDVIFWTVIDAQHEGPLT